MRFRAVIANERNDLVCGMFGTLERLESGGKREKRRAVVMLSAQEGMQLAVIAERPNEDMLAFSTINLDAFAEFRVQSMAENNIYLIAFLEHFHRALSSAKSSATCQLKLAKRRGTPCILVEFQGRDVSYVSHEIPVRVLARADAEQYQPPSLPPPALVLELPSNRSMRTVVDRLKSIGDRAKGDARFVDVKLEAAGCLSLTVATDAVVIKTFFSDLHLTEDETDQPTGSQPLVVRLRVDSRKLAQSLLGYNLPFASISCCPVVGIALILHVFLADKLGNLTFYVPAVDLDDYLQDDQHDNQDGVASAEEMAE